MDSRYWICCISQKARSLQILLDNSSVLEDWVGMLVGNCYQKKTELNLRVHGFACIFSMFRFRTCTKVPNCQTIIIQYSSRPIFFRFDYIVCISQGSRINWTYKSAKVSKNEEIQIGLVPTIRKELFGFCSPNEPRAGILLLLQVILCTFLFLLVLSKYCWVEATLNPQAHYLIIWWARKVFLKIFF